MNFSENKTFCARAWTHLATAPDGSIRPCCVSLATVNKDDGTPYNLGKDSLSDILNSDAYNDIRAKMLQGLPVAGCENCYEIEKSSNSSYRIQYNRRWQHIAKQKIMRRKVDTLEYIDLRFGNMCNLKCKSCLPENSSQYSDEIRELHDKNSSIKDLIPIFSSEDMNSWYNTELFFENIKSQIDNISELYITGGEPTIIEKNYEILEYLIANGKANKVKIVLNTNMTNVQDRFLKIIEKFYHVTFYASIDGTGQIQEYIRYPSNWQQIDKNLKKLVAANLPNVHIIVTPVIQNINLGYLVDLFDYIESFNKQHGRLRLAIGPIPLYGPDHLDLKYLPTEYKIKCWEKIDKWIRTECRFQNQHPSFHQRIMEVKTKCFEDIPYQEMLFKFKKITDEFDNHRNFYLKDVNPELYEIVYK